MRMDLVQKLHDLLISPWAPVLSRIVGAFLQVALVLFLTWLALRMADRLIRQYGQHPAATVPLTSLTQNIAKGTILVLGALVILNSFGISITPILTALGVGGLAVALGLQETLANFFSGVYITVARHVRVGNYIKLDSGEEGHVVDIAWRTTRIRSLSNNMIVVPNTKIAQAIVTNYDLPTSQLAVLVEVAVEYRSDLERAEQAAVEVAKTVMKEVPGGVPDFEPFIRYHTFGDSGIQFTVILQGKAFTDQYLLTHEFIKRLHRRFAQEGIVIPVRTAVLAPAASKS